MQQGAARQKSKKLCLGDTTLSLRSVILINYIMQLSARTKKPGSQFFGEKTRSDSGQ